MFGDEALHRVTAESAAAAGGKQRVAVSATACVQPESQEFDGGVGPLGAAASAAPARPASGRAGPRRAPGGRRGWVAGLFAAPDAHKQVNAGRAHDAGDQLLVAVAERLRAVMRPADTTARFGGDELAILLEETTEDVPRPAAQRLLEALSSPFEFQGLTVVTRAGMRAASKSDTGKRPDD